MSKIIKITLFSFLVAATLYSCEDEKNEDLTATVNKNGAIETAVTVEHFDSLQDILVTHHTVWHKGIAYKEVVYRDTIPSLGQEQKIAENADGDEKKDDIKKDYEIFITIK